MYLRSSLVTCSSLVFLCLVFSGAVIAQEESQIKFDSSLKKQTLKVSLQIADGWHTYDEVPENNPSPSTTIELTLPEGVTLDGKWKRPKGKISAKGKAISDLVSVFKGNVEFTHMLKIEPNSEAREIGVTVSYQVCNENMCLPPTDFEMKVSIPAAKAVEANAEEPLAKFENAWLEAPERLMVGDKPLNVAARQMYPSPAMYDVDNDGKPELIVGDIFGTLNVYKNEKTKEASDPVWSKHQALESAKGKKIKVSNW